VPIVDNTIANVRIIVMLMGCVLVNFMGLVYHVTGLDMSIWADFEVLCWLFFWRHQTWTDFYPNTLNP
jgi:hypothetical protein